MRTNQVKRTRYDDDKFTMYIVHCDKSNRKQQSYFSVWQFSFLSLVQFGLLYFGLVWYCSTINTPIRQNSFHFINYSLFTSASELNKVIPHKLHGCIEINKRIHGWFFSISSFDDKRQSNFRH